jgi:hypothetical protein
MSVKLAQCKECELALEWEGSSPAIRNAACPFCKGPLRRATQRCTLQRVIIENPEILIGGKDDGDGVRQDGTA